MFTIFTESPSEKDILQQDFATLNDRFHLNLAEAPAISGILRSISYELFQAAPPPIAQEFTKMAVDSLNLKLSLALYRQILVRIRDTERLLALYRQYFLSLSRLVDSPHTLDAPPPFIGLDEETSAICSLQLLDVSPSNDLLITDFQEQLQRAVGKPCPPSPMQKTRRTAEGDIPQEFTIRKTIQINLLEQSHSREKLDLTSKQVLSKWENEQWWKVKEGERDNSSRQISRFEVRRHENLLQGSITTLIAQQAEFERKREEELAKQKKQSEESIMTKFHKRMRENIVNAKLRRRRR